MTRYFVLIALIVAAAGALAACGGNNDEDASALGQGATSVATSSAVTTPKPAENVTLRLGYFANITHAQAHVGVREGIFAEELGDNVKLETITFNAGPAVIEALFAGELDISYIGPSPAINGYVKSKGEALRIIAGSASGGASLIVRPGANINSPADFANKKIATPQLGNTQDVALRAWLKGNGLKSREEGGSVTILPTANADQLTLFQKGQIDAAWSPEPWATRLVQEAGGEVFLNETSLWPVGRFVTTNIVVRTGFLEEHPDVVESFLRAHVKATQLVQQDPDLAKRVVNEGIEEITTKALPQAVIDAAWPNIEFTYDPVASSLRKSADAAFELGFLGSDKPDLSGIYRLELLNRVLTEHNLPTVRE